MPYATRYPFADLEIGDSFVVERYTSTFKNLLNVARYHERKYQKEFHVARNGDGSMTVTRRPLGTKFARKAAVPAARRGSRRYREALAAAIEQLDELLAKGSR